MPPGPLRRPETYGIAVITGVAGSAHSRVFHHVRRVIYGGAPRANKNERNASDESSEFRLLSSLASNPRVARWSAPEAGRHLSSDVRAVGHASATAFWRGVRLRSRAPLRGGDPRAPFPEMATTAVSVVRFAAHSAPGNAAGFGGDTGTVPELDAFRTTGSGASASPTIVSQFRTSTASSPSAWWPSSWTSSTARFATRP